jgi:NAD(P)H-hydrate epimerase
VLAVPFPIMAAALAIAPSATGLALPVDGDGVLRPSEVARLLDEHAGGFACLAVGPGWGAGDAQRQILVRLLAGAPCPLVLDADALNVMATVAHVQKDLRVEAILTPHPGEYRRLAAALGIEADPVDPARRDEGAEELARRLGCIVVLKGPGTVVSDGVRTWVCPIGGSALATAGTGDVLTGVVAGLVSQFGPRGSASLGLLDCARLGVHIHARAGDLWTHRRGEAGLLAGELLDLIPETLAELRPPRSGSG